MRVLKPIVNIPCSFNRESACPGTIIHYLPDGLTDRCGLATHKLVEMIG